MNLTSIKANMTELELTNKIVGGLPIKILFSYSIPVAYTDSVGTVYVTDKFWSKTTSRHINQWVAGRRTVKESQQTLYNLLKGVA